jgi:acetyl esterase/lipase
MQSVQSFTVKTFINVFRKSLFVHKTESATIRVGFERVSNITKYPRFVTKQEMQYGGLDAAWFIPDGHGKAKIILYLHGGGYVMGSYNTHRALIARVARACGCRALAVNYRKAPEHPYPAALEDAVKVYKQMIADGYENIILMGDSAGGGLVLALLQMIRKQRLQKAAAAVLLSPWTDLTMSGESVHSKKDIDPMIAPHLLEIFSKRYYGETDPAHPLISPLFADVKGFPPTLIQVGSNETLLDDATRLAKKLHKAGIPVKFDMFDNMMHVWHFFGGIMPEANKAIDEIGDFVRSVPAVNTADKLDALAVY